MYDRGYAAKQKKEDRLETIFAIIAFAVLLGGVVALFLYMDSYDFEPAYCRQMRELNPDWQFHYDQVTGCRVLFRDFWIPVDDMPDVLRGGG